MPVALKVSIPNKILSSQKFQERADALLVEIGAKTLNDLKKYPPAQPWKSKPPKTGLRAGGKRTGTLGRNWSMSKSVSGSVEVMNETPYADWVQGEHQTHVMSQRNWKKAKPTAESAVTSVLNRFKFFE